MAAAKTERGAITAELVLALPTVFLILATALGALSVQLQRMEMVSNAALLARSIAAGDPVGVVDAVVSELGDGIEFEIHESDGMVCVFLKANLEVFGFDFGDLELVENQCARAQGG